MIEYQVVKGKRNMKVYGAGFSDKQSAVDYLIVRQREYGDRGMRVIKLVPYGTNMRQIIELK